MDRLASLRSHLQGLRLETQSGLLHKLSSKTSSHPLLPVYVGLLCLSVVLINTRKQLYLLGRFAYSCFLAPIGHSSEQKNRLDAFYSSQATIYDATRARLLKGREEMLRLTASHLQDQVTKRQTRGEKAKKLVWVDIGGGTGWNIEKMDEYFSISKFHAVFLIDLCEPLLDVARKRFAEKGWENVHVLCQDASNFVLPDVDGDLPITELSLCTMSYSLSMIPNFYGMLDRVERFLDPINGLVGVVDFYISDRGAKEVMNAGDTLRHCSWWTRWFWLHWFEWDHVDLHPSRRNYLEWRFGTMKSINARNSFGHIAAIPYYIWLGCKAHRDLPERLSIFGADPLTPAFSPALSVSTPALEMIPDLTLSPALAPTLPRSSSITSMNLPRRSSGRVNSVIDMIPPPSPMLEPTMTGTPLSAFYYQKHNYRMPYQHGDDQKLFRSWIYGFTWEDPIDDMKRMKIAKNDTVLCITSAGDNALHYAIKGQPKRIHCVDMNPCQGHLLELKLAAINALEYKEFWQLFGQGKHPDFETLLDSKLAAHLSAHAYNFWKANSAAFESAFYLKGYSGWALRILNTIFAMRGQTADLTAFAEAETLADQRRIYEKKIRPVLLSGSFVKLILSNPVFLWNSLGVPMNQLAMLQSESSVKQYCIDTLDPLGRTVHIRKENYHYYLCLTSRYHPENPPAYLTPDGFASLKAAECTSLEAFRLHTDSLDNVIRTVEPGTLDVWIGMDHQDWFSPANDVEAIRSSIRAIRRAMPVGGRAFWRSAAMKPWYAEIWATEGFRVERLSNRAVGTDKPIDSVNMYASLWRAIRV